MMIRESQLREGVATVELEVGLHPPGQPQQLLLVVGKRNQLDVDGQTCGICHRLLDGSGDVVRPLTIVVLLGLGGDGDREGADSHAEDVPDKGVGGQDGGVVGEAVVGGLGAETGADDVVQLLPTPELDPLLLQGVGSSATHNELVRCQFAGSLDQHLHPGLAETGHGLHAAEETAVEAGDGLKVGIFLGGWFSLQHILVTLHAALPRQVTVEAENGISLAGQRDGEYFMALLLEEVRDFVQTPAAAGSALNQLQIFQHADPQRPPLGGDLLIESDIEGPHINVGIAVLPKRGRMCHGGHPEGEGIDGSAHRTSHHPDKVHPAEPIAVASELNVFYVHVPMLGNRFCPERSVLIPQKAAGMRRLPPISFPTPTGLILPATAAASPPELPPTDLFLFHGFRALPHTSLFESKFMASCGRFVFTKGIIPALFIASAKKPSCFTIRLARTLNPTVEVVPSRSMLSLREVGMPKRGGRYFSASQGVLSSRVQLALPVVCRRWSHSADRLSAQSKQSSVMMHMSLPKVAARTAKMATNC